MKRILTAFAACGLVLAAPACTTITEKESTGGGVVEEVESAAEGVETEAGEGAAVGACDDGVVTGALAGIVDATGVAFASDDSYGSTLSCTWDDGTDMGPSVYLSVSTTPPTDITEEFLESMGQEYIEDSRFEGLGVVPAVVLGCENGSAADLVGCAVVVYGTGTDLSLQVLMGDDVTQDQIVDALWAITEEVYA